MVASTMKDSPKKWKEPVLKEVANWGKKTRGKKRVQKKKRCYLLYIKKNPKINIFFSFKDLPLLSLVPLKPLFCLEKKNKTPSATPGQFIKNQIQTSKTSRLLRQIPF